jgi:hypothetical protein
MAAAIAPSRHRYSDDATRDLPLCSIVAAAALLVARE